jgi:homocysteine S-methyltransferase
MTRLLDGAMGTELARRGFELRAPLWGARALQDAPALVEAIHRDYVEAGADALVTASFGLRADDTALARTSVQRCRAAGATTCIGAIAPLAPTTPTTAYAEYVGTLGRALRDAGADVLFAETHTTVAGAHLAAQALRPLGLPVWVALACAHEAKTLGGDTLAGVSLDADVVFVGCTEATALPAALEALAPGHPTLGARPSLARTTADGFEPEGADAADVARTLLACAERFALAWVGGCCGTTPAFIDTLAQGLRG